MLGLMKFLTASVATILDPFAAIGYVCFGVFIKRYFFAICAGAIWAIAMDVFVASISLTYEHQNIVPRLFGSLLAVSVIFLIAKWRRETKRQLRK